MGGESNKWGNLRPPKVPKLNKEVNLEGVRKEKSDYYRRTLEEAVAVSFSRGANRLTIELDERLDFELNEVISLFQGGFDLSRVICYAYQCLKRGLLSEKELRNFGQLGRGALKLRKFRPDKDCVKAIGGLGGEDAASVLARAGISILYNKNFH